VTYRIAVLSALWSAASGRFYRKGFDLALREWRVLAVLSRMDAADGRDGAGGPPMAGELARLTGVEKAGVSRALAALARRGLVETTRSEDDARRSGVALTRAGRALLKRLAPAALERQASLVSVFSPAERRTFFALLEKLERRAVELGGEKGSPNR
jgi:DNA-binding MarR family transcriptional regulator